MWERRPSGVGLHSAKPLAGAWERPYLSCGAASPERETFMTPEERQMLSGLFDRVRNASNGPKDTEAEGFINDAMRSAPSAGYVLAQTVLVQQQALEAAAKRIQELDAQTKNAAPHEEGSFLGNLGKSLFGSGQPSAPQRAYERPAAPQPGYGGPQPGYGAQQPGYAPQQPASPWSQAAAPMAPGRGGGFLSGALQTATGVAGGVMLGNALGGLLGGHGGGLFGGGGFGGGMGGETVNNYYQDNPADQHAQDVLQDQDQDQDDQQDAFDNSGGGGGGGDDDFV